MKKTTAWIWFSKYVRLRDCLKTTGTDDHGRCYTCGKIKHFKQLQAGHGIGGRTAGILFDDEITKAQCVNCNYFKKGNYEAFVPKLIAEKGVEWFEEKKVKAKTPLKIDIKEEAKKWREKYNKLKGENYGY